MRYVALLIALALPTYSFAEQNLTCKVQSQNNNKAWLYFKEFQIQTDGQKISGKYLNLFNEKIDITNDNIENLISLENNIITISIDTWVGYDHYVANAKIENKQGSLTQYESIDCLGEDESEFTLICE